MPKDIAKRTIKDSVFTHMFRDKAYVARMYNELHPGENITAGDIEIVTLENVITDGIYNDLGFIVKDQLIVLAEAQSTWSVNIIIRALMYLVKSWQEHVDHTRQSVYNSLKLKLPKPELYVIYTGDKKLDKEEFSLAEEFFGGNNSVIDVKIKVISHAEKIDLLGQYILFCKIADSVIKEMGRTEDAILNILRICEDENILNDYLSEHRREAYDIMVTLYSQEYIQDSFIKSLQKQYFEEGEARGEAKGLIAACRDFGASFTDTVNKVASKLGISVDEAQKTVADYWN